MNKKGFSLAELVMVLLILSVLIVCGMSIFKNASKGTKFLHSNVLNYLDKALYNSMMYWVTEDEKTRNPFDENIDDESDAPSRLCKALIEYINTTTDACNNLQTVDDSGEDSLFTDQKLAFVSHNGTKFWISNRYYNKNNDKNHMKFFIVYVDINGKKRPNTLQYAGGNEEPDIFAFALMEDGRALPIGIAEFDSRFMTTRLSYQVYNEDEQDFITEYTVHSKSYVESKAEAWGYYVSSTVDDSDIIEGVPYTYNGYIRSTISPTSKIYSFMQGQDYKTYMSQNLSGFASFSLDEKHGCSALSDEICDVFVDKFR